MMGKGRTIRKVMGVGQKKIAQWKKKEKNSCTKKV
jgi:hypothetical protein